MHIRCADSSLLPLLKINVISKINTENMEEPFRVNSLRQIHEHQLTNHAVWSIEYERKFHIFSRCHYIPHRYVVINNINITSATARHATCIKRQFSKRMYG